MTFPFDVAPKEILWYLLGILSSAVIGYIFYRIGLPKKRLSYSVERRRIVWTTGNYPDALRITFNNNPVTDLSRLVVYIWNSGTQPIIKTDLSTSDRLRLIFNEFAKSSALQVSVGNQTRQANNARLEDDYVVFDYLNAGDGLTVDLFIESAHVAKFSNVGSSDVRSPIIVDGEIIGAQSKPGYVQYSDIGKPRELLFTTAGSGALALFGGSTVVSAIEEGNLDVLQIVFMSFLGLVSAVAVPVFFYSLYVLLRKPKVPKLLQAT